MISFVIVSIARVDDPTSPFSGLFVATAKVQSVTPNRTDLLGQQVEVVDHCGCSLSNARIGEKGSAFWEVAKSSAVGVKPDELTPPHWSMRHSMHRARRTAPPDRPSHDPHSRAAKTKPILPDKR